MYYEGCVRFTLKIPVEVQAFAVWGPTGSQYVSEAGLSQIHVKHNIKH